MGRIRVLLYCYPIAYSTCDCSLPTNILKPLILRRGLRYNCNGSSTTFVEIPVVTRSSTRTFAVSDFGVYIPSPNSLRSFVGQNNT
ncbi:hypothetical protein BJ170DRAFT_604443 [Xylariales sp. AK1849]|nr:hypothetical protein BJ170DRAFT_604443 [Xylariales sp. AK1849]